MIVGTSYSNKFRFCTLNVIVLGFVFHASIIAAQNLATNPGFETGNTTGWFALGSPTISAQSVQVHSGSYASIVTNRTATWNGIAQSFLGILQSNQAYAVSAWVQLAGGASQTMQLTAQKIDGSGTTYSAIASGTVSNGAWTQLTGQYTLNISNSLTGLTFYLEVPTSTNAAYYVDDLLVQAVNAPTNNGQCTVDWNDVHQRIDGFGASSAWRSTWNSTLADLLFSTNNGVVYTDNLGSKSTNNGVGLSLLRNRITCASSTAASAIPGTVETSIMQMAQARGARVWSSPWTPAAGFKSSGVLNGGNYLGGGANATNLAYASQLANYVVRMKNNYGVNLYAISIQNEPDGNHPDTYVTNSMTGIITTNFGYESCVWTGQKIHDFTTNLYNALVAGGVGSTKIMLPESQNWTDPQNLAAPAMNDASVSADVGIVANHNYVANNTVGDINTPAAINSYGKALWETEVSLLSGSDSSITNGIYYAKRIHLFMTAAQANAYHYWWLIAGGAGNDGLLDNNAAVTKRLFVFGQFSRFVRPNFYRIGVNNPGSVLVSAYKDSVSPGFAIVAINPNSFSTNETFVLTNFSNVSVVTPWITSSDLSLASQATITVTSNLFFTYALPAMSVVTFVGQNTTNLEPTIAPVPNQTINAGMTLIVTNVATDPNVPPQPLTFRLLDGPTNAALTTVSGTNGIFSWRPLVSQAATTNLVSVQVADSGSPNLSATNNFNVVVNPLARPLLGSIMISGGQVSLAVNGPQGPDYTLLTTTNLTTGWQVLLTTNSPVMPAMLVDTNLVNAERFYRLQLGP